MMEGVPYCNKNGFVWGIKVPVGVKHAYEKVLFDDALLGEPSVELQLGLDVFFVKCHKALEAHIDVSLLLHQKLALPCLRLFFRGKAAL